MCVGVCLVATSPERPLVRCVRIRRGVSTVQLGQSIGADLSLPSAIYGNGPTESDTLCDLTSLSVFQPCKQETNELLLLRARSKLANIELMTSVRIVWTYTSANQTMMLLSRPSFSFVMFTSILVGCRG